MEEEIAEISERNLWGHVYAVSWPLIKDELAGQVNFTLAPIHCFYSPIIHLFCPLLIFFLIISLLKFMCYSWLSPGAGMSLNDSEQDPIKLVGP